jgi:hypothetical protein
VGLDLLPDFFFKSRKVYNAIKPKLLWLFNEWLNKGGNPIPEYLQTMKIFALSKSESHLTPFPKLRLINIA